MKCPKCKKKMIAQSKMDIDNITVIRDYACLKCLIVYSSRESLNIESTEKKVWKSKITEFSNRDRNKKILIGRRKRRKQNV